MPLIVRHRTENDMINIPFNTCQHVRCSGGRGSCNSMIVTCLDSFPCLLSIIVILLGFLWKLGIIYCSAESSLFWGGSKPSTCSTLGDLFGLHGSPMSIYALIPSDIFPDWVGVIVTFIVFYWKLTLLVKEGCFDRSNSEYFRSPNRGCVRLV